MCLSVLGVPVKHLTPLPERAGAKVQTLREGTEDLRIWVKLKRVRFSDRNEPFKDQRWRFNMV